MQEIPPPEKAPRVRHDKWKAARRAAFCEASSRGGSVRDAYEVVGKSAACAYKARDRVRGFRNRWGDAVGASRPSTESEMQRRAVEGWDQPIFQGSCRPSARRAGCGRRARAARDSRYGARGSRAGPDMGGQVDVDPAAGCDVRRRSGEPGAGG